MNYLPEFSNNFIERLLKEQGIMNPLDKIDKRCSPGPGNMNYVQRIQWGDKSCILKQTPPFCAKYPNISAPQQRQQAEVQFYHFLDEGQIESSSHVHRFYPEVFFENKSLHLFALEDLGEAENLNSIYGESELSSAEAQKMGSLLGKIHNTNVHSERRYQNQEARELNFQHIFEIPFSEGNWPEGRFLERIKSCGEIYRLSVGEFLLHGDFYPGSLLKGLDRELYVIDPEFSFFGPVEFDLGVALAHLRLAGQNKAREDDFMGAYKEYGVKFDVSLNEDFANIEILRRIFGVAKLPLTLTKERTSALIDEAKKYLNRS